MNLDKLLERQEGLIIEAERLLGEDKEEINLRLKRLIERFAFLMKLRGDLVWYDSPQPERLKYNNPEYLEKYKREYYAFWDVIRGLESKLGVKIDRAFIEREQERISREWEEVE